MKNRISTLIKTASEGIWEKEHIFSLALLCSIAGESIFLLGPPGTAKSMVARRLKLVFKEQKSFEYLMSRFSTPDEIFGPVSISKLKDCDVYERRIDGYLPSASVVFLDEIWKAGPAIQNTLLTVINEKIYQNGNHTIKLPMKALIAASNELPEEDEGLEALWDRFLVRIVSNCISNEKTFYKMLRQDGDVEVKIPDELCITDEQYYEWQQNISTIDIPNDILESITFIRKNLKDLIKAEGTNTLDYYISDRRWKKVVHLLQTSAFLNGRSMIQHTDMCLLYHTLWNKRECISSLLEIITKSFFVDLYEKLGKIEKELDYNIKSILPTKTHNALSEFKVYNYFYFKVLNFSKGNCFIFMSDYKHIDTVHYTDGVIYWDEGQKAYLIRILDINRPFASSQISNYQMKNIKIRKTIGGIEVGNDSYQIEKDIIATNKQEEVLPFEEVDYSATFNENISNFRNDLKERIESMSKGKNLFISSDDIKLVKKEGSALEKEIRQIELKANGLFKSINR